MRVVLCCPSNLSKKKSAPARPTKAECFFKTTVSTQHYFNQPFLSSAHPPRSRRFFSSRNCCWCCRSCRRCHCGWRRLTTLSVRQGEDCTFPPPLVRQHPAPACTLHDNPLESSINVLGLYLFACLCTYVPCILSISSLSHV